MHYFFGLISSSKSLCEYIRVEHQDYKNESIEKRYLDNMQNNQFLKEKTSLLELEKYFTEWTDIELKDKKKNLKRQKSYLVSQLLCLKMTWISLKNKN